MIDITSFHGFTLFWTLFTLCLVDPSHSMLRRNLFPSTDAANSFVYLNEKNNNLHSSRYQVQSSNALFLTPYIQSGKLAEGRRLSEVHNLPGNAPQISSYSGFLTVNQTYNSNIFFWFFPALVGLLLLYITKYIT